MTEQIGDKLAQNFFGTGQRGGGGVGGWGQVNF